MQEEAKVFLCDLDPWSGIGNTLKGILESSSKQGIQLSECMKYSTASDPHSNLCSIISRSHYDVLFLACSQKNIDQAQNLLKSVSYRQLELPIIIAIDIDEDKQTDIFELLKIGVSDFITPPLKSIDILPRIWRLLEYKSEFDEQFHLIKETMGLHRLVGKSRLFLNEICKIPTVAQCNVSVLISGETGTGKELCARAIHYLGQRSNGPFIPISCGTLPVGLVESELFGHVKGAFTGAVMAHSGLIHMANGGSLFLDEIDSLPLSAQVKLLRFLQEKEYRQVGSNKLSQSDVRVIAATNSDLKQAIENQMFRKDLYYRLNIIPFTLPPLRDRDEDIPLLAKHFSLKYASELNKSLIGISPLAVEKLMLYDWPGNVRELENVIQRAVIFAKNKFIQSEDILLSPEKTIEHRESFKAMKAKVVEEFEKTYIKKLLFAHQGNISKAAKTAQKNRRAFWQLLKKHQIDASPFRLGQSSPEAG